LTENKDTIQIEDAAQLFSIFSEPARLKILNLLRDGARCGRELAKDLNLTPATTCHHLERLKLAHLLSVRRSGKHVYYSIVDSELAQAVERSVAVLAGPKSRAEAKAPGD
jgi:ArsR family transcriptional regulator